MAIQNGDFENAIAIYEHLLKKYPHDEEIFSELSLTYTNLFNRLKNYTSYSAQDIYRLRSWLRKGFSFYNSFYAASLRWFYIIVTFLIIVFICLDSYAGKGKKR